MASLKYFFIIALVLILLAGPIGTISAFRTSAATTSLSVPAQAGCWVQQTPGAAWQSTACGAPPKIPYIPAGDLSGSTVGDDDDYAATPAVSGTLIGSTEGTFPSVSPPTITEVGGKGLCNGCGQCYGGDGAPNCFSLQLNSQVFTCNTPYTDGNTVTATYSEKSGYWTEGCWQQFVYSNDNKGIAGDGAVFIQWWLLNYCAASAPPGYEGCSYNPPYFSCPTYGDLSWMESGDSCFLSSPDMTLTTPSGAPTGLTAAQLDTVTLTGDANYEGTGNDLVSLSISGGASYAVNMGTPDNLLDLYSHWTQSEFNVVGDMGGSNAVFSAGTSITVNTALFGGNGHLAGKCLSDDGTTGETNNLYLEPLAPPNSIPPSGCTGTSTGISFVESNTPVCTPSYALCGVLNFPDILNLNCPPICTVPQNQYEELTVSINNPDISSLSLVATPGDAPVSANCVNSVCGPYIVDLTPGTWTLTFTPSALGASGGTAQPLIFTLQVTSGVLPTPEFPLGSLLAFAIPLMSLFFYKARTKSRAFKTRVLQHVH